jgi:hypothetical protein
VRNFAHVGGRLTAKLGALVGLSARTIEKARQLRDCEPKIAEDVLAGMISLEDALRKMDTGRDRSSSRKLYDVPHSPDGESMDQPPTKRDRDDRSNVRVEEVDAAFEEPRDDEEPTDNEGGLRGAERLPVHDGKESSPKPVVQSQSVSQAAGQEIFDWFQQQEPIMQHAILKRLNAMAHPFGRIVDPENVKCQTFE